MKRIGKTTIFVVLALVLALGSLGLFGILRATAVEPGKYLVDGNPNCANLYQSTVLSGPDGHTGLADLGPLFGFKIDEYSDYYTPPSGDLEFTLTAGTQHGYPTVLTESTPSDPDNSVTLINSSEYLFDWAATLGIDAVIVKAQDANAYVYAPEAFGASGLEAPEGKAISHIEFCYDYELDVTKDAEGKYDRTITWDLSKSVSPDAHIGFIGDSFDSTWTVAATKNVVEDNYRVTGDITIVNPAPIAVSFDVSDLIDGTIAASVDCGGGSSSGTVAANSSTTCSYSATSGIDGDEAENVATVTSNTEGVAGGSDAADITWSADVYGDESVTVDDDRNPSGFPTSISDSATFTYDETFYCSTILDDYTGGKDSDNYPNTATATGDSTNLSKSADVDVDCYIPSIEKTAAGTYDERHTWTVEKTVSPSSQAAFAGETVTFDWTITVDETVTDENFDVAGTITVNNPNPEDALVVALSDVVNGNAATITSCTGGTYSAGTLTVAASGTAVCNYEANDLDYDDVALAPDENKATITLNGIDFDATDPIEWTLENVFDDEATLDDDWQYDGQSVDDGWTGTYEDSYTCSTDLGDYADGADLDNQVSNTAEVYTGDTLQDSSTATTEIDCYIPDISKTANGSYVEYHDWDVEKSVTPASQSAFAGETVYFDWTIDVTEEVYEDDYLVTGQITVYNPNPEDALTVALADELNDGTIASIGPCTGGSWDGTDLTVPAGGTATCDYTAAPGGGPGLNNFAAELPDQVQFSVTYPVNGGEAYFPHVYVTGAPLTGDFDGWCIDTQHVIYQNTTYLANVYSSYEDLTGKVDKPQNMDLVNWIVNQGFVGTDAGGGLGNYTYSDVQYAIWTLIDDAVSTAGLYDLNTTRAAQIVAAAQANGEGFVPDCSDYIAVVLQSTTGEQVIAVTQVTFIEVELDCPAENTATATLGALDFTATEEINWTFTVEDDEAWMDDVQYPFIDEPVYDGYSVTYTDDDGYTCSANPEDYTDGELLDNEVSNTADVYSDSGPEDSSTATTYIDCYAPVVDKTAAGTYDERHEWTVDKTVTPDSQGGYPGDVLGWTWTVYVYEDVYEENFDVAGTITVGNPNPEDVLIVPLADVLSDGTPGVIDRTSCAFDGANLTVQPNSSETCDYAANDLGYADDAAAPNNNTALVLLNGITFSADDAIEWTANRIRENATLTDAEIGLNESLTGHAQAGTYTFGPYTGGDSHTCSTNRADYFVGGVYTQMSWTLVNWAYVYSDDALQDSDDATTTYTCDASFVDIYKTTNGQPADPEDDIQFALYSYDGATPVQEEIVSTLGVGANLQFQTALVPGDGYTICEYPVPAAYTFEISVNGDLVLTYAGPPGEENPTGEIQCFDFTAEPAGTTVTFDVENRYPGGAPRTPGYWKNWNRCSGGNQAATADKLNDYLGPIDGAGVFLLDDLLQQTIGDFTIETCEVGVLILNSRNVSTSKNMSNDAAYTLAKSLLAARLNQDAGACVPLPFDPALECKYGKDTVTFDYFEDVLTAADEVLTDVGFDGTDGYLGPKNKKQRALAAYALCLYEIIDDYNNSEICTGDPSH